ncbi:MAG: M48 family metalloprotease [Chloroflexota bacterium]
MVELNQEGQKKASMLEPKGRRIFRVKNVLPMMLIFIWILIYLLSRLFLFRSFYNNWYYARSFFFGYIEIAFTYYLVALFVSYYSFYKTQHQIEFTSIGFLPWCLYRFRASFIGLGSLKRFAEIYPLDEQKYSGLSSLLREQAKRDGIINFDLLVYPGSKFSKALNAAIIGSSKKCSIVLWDGIISGDFSDAEIASTVAHEQGHFIHKHNDQLSFLRKLILSGSAIIFLLVFGGMSVIDPSKGNLLFMAFPLSLFLTCIFIQVGLLLLRATSRQMEYLADAHAINITSDSMNVRNAFVKEVNLSLIDFSPSPFNEFVYDDHPSTRKRLNLLAGTESTWK